MWVSFGLISRGLNKWFISGHITTSPIKLETRLRPNSAGIPHTLLLRIEATGFPTFGLSLYGLGLYGILKRSIRVPRRLPFMDPWRNPSRLPFILVAETV